jgi:hypothetical protein
VEAEAGEAEAVAPLVAPAVVQAVTQEMSEESVQSDKVLKVVIL